MGKKKRIMILIAFVMSLMLMMNTEVFASQEDNDWYDLKDYNITISLPQGSEVSEYSDEDIEADGHIITATVPIGENGPLNLDLYYSATDYDDEYIYFYADKQAALDYYENIGEDAIIDCIGEQIDQDYNLSIEPDKYDSIAGHIIHELGHIPVAGEQIRIRGITFRVERVDRNRIESIRILLPEDNNASVEKASPKAIAR